VRPTFYAKVGKRCLDLSLASAGLVLLAPLFLVVGLAVRLTSRGPAFFRQARMGQFGGAFRIFKFRTMQEDRSGGGSLLTASGDPRITRLGGWLRKTKIDELPQLINVFRGEMSLVGPRPVVFAEAAGIGDKQQIIALAKPGITGPSANVYEEELLASQPNKESFYLSTILPTKLAIDVRYCQDIRLKTDLRVLLGTLLTLARRLAELCGLLHAESPSANQKAMKL
jgi:lipopolysaccharide/colanic/teichoic acid biosynthesis glycosyltransferase